ncbi:MAG: 4Fe-4S dicluster domain-containing protein [Myxococcaceae bacterium]|nr:4Fe-4S dicluster domain-containing protein [Myxococcaceae bacterium]
MTLSLRWEACVRTRSTSAACRACVDACPTGAITLDGPRSSVKVELAACTRCGLCQPACPDEAFSGVADVGAFMATAGPSLACGPTLCLQVLAVEDLITLALRHGNVKVDGAGCQACREHRAVVLERLEQANTFLLASGFEARLVTVVKPGAAPVLPEKPAVADSRRALLRRLLPGLAPAPSTAGPLALAPLGAGTLEPSRLRERPLPARRERLLAALKHVTRARPPAVLEADEVPFTSLKALDVVTCTGCMQCVSVCPTAALTASRAQDEVRFETGRCLKCRACHDACAPGSITVAKRFEPARFLESQPVSLARFQVKDCGECGARFKYDGGDALCPRCIGQDDEARALHGLPPRPPGASA